MALSFELTLALEKPKRDSRMLSTHNSAASAASSSASDDSKATPKSFGIRKLELILDQLNSVPLKVLHFGGIFVGQYCSALEFSVVAVLKGYATESYKQHSLMATVALIHMVVSASAMPAFAMLSDLFGRLQLFCLGLVLRVVGLVVMSQATTIEKHAGGEVLYGAGFAGCKVLFQICAQDATSLRTRLWANALVTFPVVITTWSSGEVVSSVLDSHGWRFGIAMWAFIFPLSCVPYLVSYLVVRWKAFHTREWGSLVEEERLSQAEMEKYRAVYRNAISKSGITFRKKVTANITLAAQYAKYKTVKSLWEVDIVGCVLLVVVFGLILVPITLAGGTLTNWRTAKIIVPLVSGFCCIPVFITWEFRWARKPLIPFPLLKDRGVWSGFAVAILSTLATNIPNTYAYPVLVVGMNASSMVATRTPQLAMFVTALVLPFLGYVVFKVRRTKGFILFGNCVLFVSMGLFVHFKGDNDGVRGKYFRDGMAVAYAVEGFGNGFFIKLVGVSVQTCTNHEHMATVSALFSSLYSIGSACAKCISGAIWAQRMYPTILKHMNELGVDSLLAKDAFTGPYKFITTAPWRSPARKAVVLAYAEIQSALCIVSLCLLVPLLALALCLRDHKLNDHRSLENAVDVEKGDSEAQREKSTVVFGNNDDPIFRFIRRVIERKSPNYIVE